MPNINPSFTCHFSTIQKVSSNPSTKNTEAFRDLLTSINEVNNSKDPLIKLVVENSNDENLFATALSTTFQKNLDDFPKYNIKNKCLVQLVNCLALLKKDDISKTLDAKDENALDKMIKMLSETLRKSSGDVPEKVLIKQYWSKLGTLINKNAEGIFTEARNTSVCLSISAYAKHHNLQINQDLIKPEEIFNINGWESAHQVYTSQKAGLSEELSPSTEIYGYRLYNDFANIMNAVEAIPKALKHNVNDGINNQDKPDLNTATPKLNTVPTVPGQKDDTSHIVGKEGNGPVHYHNTNNNTQNNDFGALSLILKEIISTNTKLIEELLSQKKNSTSCTCQHVARISNVGTQTENSVDKGLLEKKMAPGILESISLSTFNGSFDSDNVDVDESANSPPKLKPTTVLTSVQTDTLENNPISDVSRSSTRLISPYFANITASRLTNLSDVGGTSMEANFRSSEISIPDSLSRNGIDHNNLGTYQPTGHVKLTTDKNLSSVTDGNIHLNKFEFPAKEVTGFQTALEERHIDKSKENTDALSVSEVRSKSLPGMFLKKILEDIYNDKEVKSEEGNLNKMSNLVKIEQNAATKAALVSLQYIISSNEDNFVNVLNTKLDGLDSSRSADIIFLNKLQDKLREFKKESLHIEEFDDVEKGLIERILNKKITTGKIHLTERNASAFAHPKLFF